MNAPSAPTLYSVDGKRVEKEPVEGKDVYLINNKEAADAILERMKKALISVATALKKKKKDAIPSRRLSPRLCSRKPAATMAFLPHGR